MLKEMANKINWNTQLDSRRIDLIVQGFSYSAVASILNNEFPANATINADAVQNRCRATETTKAQLMSKSNVARGQQLSMANVKSTTNKGLFPTSAYDIDESVTFTPEKKRRLEEIYDELNDGKAKKILSLSDLHAPFINFEAVEKALIEHSDADVLILNGDVFDGHALSDFDKLNDFDIEIEFEQVFMFLDVATKLFDRVYYVGGNHDMSRFVRMVARKFGQGMKNYVLKRLNPIEYVCEKYSNLTIVPHQFIQVGEAIFNHPDGYSSALMSTAMGQEKAIRANANTLLPNPKFSLLCQGHTHDLGEYYVNDCKIMEQGCLCHPMDYRFDKPTSRRWQLGYAVVQLNADGSVDFNKSRTYSAE
jgi:predicted phosphodiesterase